MGKIKLEQLSLFECNETQHYVPAVGVIINLNPEGSLVVPLLVNSVEVKPVESIPVIDLPIHPNPRVKEIEFDIATVSLIRNNEEIGFIDVDLEILSVFLGLSENMESDIHVTFCEECFTWTISLDPEKKHSICSYDLHSCNTTATKADAFWLELSRYSRIFVTFRSENELIIF